MRFTLSPNSLLQIFLLRLFIFIISRSCHARLEVNKVLDAVKWVSESLTSRSYTPMCVRANVLDNHFSKFTCAMKVAYPVCADVNRFITFKLIILDYQQLSHSSC